MGKYAMEQLKEKLCRELELMAEKRDMSPTDLDRSQKIIDTLKNIYKIDMYESGGYSGNGNWAATGNYYRDYGGESRNYRGSYGNTDYSRGGYSRDSSYPRDYSREYSGDPMVDHLDAMMREARTEEERRAIEEMRRKLM